MTSSAMTKDSKSCKSPRISRRRSERVHAAPDANVHSESLVRTLQKHQNKHPERWDQLVSRHVHGSPEVSTEEESAGSLSP